MDYYLQEVVHQCRRQSKRSEGALAESGWTRAYLGGGHWAMTPPLGRQDSIISIEKYAKLWHGHPFVTWAEGLSTETVGEDLFLAKNRTKFE